MIRLVLWVLTPDGWHRAAAVPVSPARADAALASSEHWIPAARRGLMRFELEQPPVGPVPVFAGAVS